MRSLQRVPLNRLGLEYDCVYTYLRSILMGLGIYLGSEQQGRRGIVCLRWLYDAS